MTIKQELFDKGVKQVTHFCEINTLNIPKITSIGKDHRSSKVKACAWYVSNSITIKIWACAGIGRGGPAWSYPGYVIDRTPYGVLAHELGHYVDEIVASCKSKSLRKRTGEEKLTNYCPNDSEWFAEIFRLFVTNPNLLSKLRPKIYEELISRFNIIEDRSWEEVLIDAPLRTINQACKKINSILS